MDMDFVRIVDVEVKPVKEKQVIQILVHFEGRAGVSSPLIFDLRENLARKTLSDLEKALTDL